ncbi:hypothetical protein GCM10010417_42990 [Streptomyces carpaticus]
MHPEPLPERFGHRRTGYPKGQVGGPQPPGAAEGEERAVPAGSNAKEERQYEHIKKGQKKRGASEGRAKEIAARTVNKQRARAGETKTASKTSTRDPKSAYRRGGERSHQGPQGPTKDQLYAEARKKNVDGRSSMNKEQLRKALGR